MVVQEWLRGKTIFVTGGTGFMGKVLIEKLLRCSEVKRIYMLVRPKRGMGATARIDNMAKIPLFSKLMEMNPAAIKKIIPLEGDITEENLGLKKEDIIRLVQETEIVFNCAASLRLEAELKMAVEHNTLSTYRMLQLARQMKKLQVFAHLSTAFCHCELEVLEERTYPSEVSPHDIMNIVRWMDDDTLRKITPKLLGQHPNCYTFSKRLAEDLVAEEKKNVPVCIVRPSIVVAAIEEPLPGWVDSLNGPMGILVGSGKGVIKTVLCNANYNVETIPVDIAINAFILAACKRATLMKEEELPVFNVSTSHMVKLTWGELLERSRKIVYEYPFEGGIWYPEGNIRTNRLVHWLIIIFLHYLPAYLIDFLMILIRQKRFMVRLQDRITVGLGVLEYFTTKPWNFRIDNAFALHDHLTEQEKNIFYIHNVDTDIDRFLVKTVLGARQYLMKEPLSTLPRARRHQMIDGELPVCNVSTSHMVKVTWGEMLEKARKILYEYPFDGGIWYPEGNIRTNRLVHWLIIIFLHYLPAYLIDFLMILIRQKRFMVRLQDRITVGLGVLEHFTTKQWNFRIENTLELHDHLTEQEKNIFYVHNVDTDIDRFLLKTILGARQYLMKEPLSTLPRARRHTMMLYIISRVTRVIVYGLLAWWTLQLLLRMQTYFGYSFQGLAETPVIGKYMQLKSQ